jgi:hypothetical protein
VPYEFHLKRSPVQCRMLIMFIEEMLPHVFQTPEHNPKVSPKFPTRHDNVCNAAIKSGVPKLKHVPSCKDELFPLCSVRESAHSLQGFLQISERIHV